MLSEHEGFSVLDLLGAIHAAVSMYEDLAPVSSPKRGPNGWVPFGSLAKRTKAGYPEL